MKPDAYALGLVGYPLEHSLSPRLHHAALGAMGLSGEYRLFTIAPLPEGRQALERLLAEVRRGELHGLNVTIPHKQNVMSLLDELSPAARAIGAVNTIYLQDGRLFGDNTDAPGFLADLVHLLGERLDASFPPRALILGAGGSARAVAYALSEAGWRVVVAARRLEQARDLVNSMENPVTGVTSSLVDRRWSRDVLTAFRLDERELGRLSSTVDLVVNTTPVGMWPHVEGVPWPEGVALPEMAAVYDLVYNPPETALVKAARAAGIPARSGLGMLIEQAALALERWTGREVPRQSMWDAVPEFVLKERYD